jgi:REP element-mobilizing transposase RayT
MGGLLIIGCVRQRRFLNSFKSRPEFGKQVANQRKEAKDKLSWDFRQFVPGTYQMGAVLNLLRHFDADRYELDGCIVMPNHVHLLAERAL